MDELVTTFVAFSTFLQNFAKRVYFFFVLATMSEEGAQNVEKLNEPHSRCRNVADRRIVLVDQIGDILS